MKAVIVIGKNYSFNSDDFNNSYVIGVDKGAYLCLKNNIKLDVAIGDFDSITIDEFNLLNKYTKIIKLNPIKDETDTAEALSVCKDFDEITILGGIAGNRIEHFYANLLLLQQNKKIKIKDDNSLIFTIAKDTILPKNEYKFISIFSIEEESIISLKGFKYNLDNYKMTRFDSLGVSNEIIALEASIKVHKGHLLIILSKDDN